MAYRIRYGVPLACFHFDTVIEVYAKGFAAGCRNCNASTMLQLELKLLYIWCGFVQVLLQLMDVRPIPDLLMQSC